MDFHRFQLMTAWVSPFPLAEALEEELREIGWTRWVGDPHTLPSDICWLYDPPDRLFSLTGLGPDELETGYRRLLACSAGSRCVAIGRILAEAQQPVEPPDPLCAALTQLFIAQLPALLDAYLDLELKADLLGGAPDVGYQRRLAQLWSPSSVVARWGEVCEAPLREAELRIEALQAEREELRRQQAEACEEAELTLLQLHQVQEELERYFLLSQGQAEQLQRYSTLQRRSQQLMCRLVPAR